MKKNHLMMLIALTIGLSGIFMSFQTNKFPTQDQKTSGQAVYDKDGKLLQVRYVRKNAHEDNENMQILADALKIMKEKDCDDPMSWYMQGAIHGGPFEANYFCPEPIYSRAKNDAWHNCTHGDAFEVDTTLTKEGRWMHFYTWHKIYLNHFEDIIRAVSKRPDFVLPYWEYDSTKYQTMPPLFLDKNSSLYEAYRNDYMNRGNKIQVEAGYKDSLDGQKVYDLTSPSIAFDAKDFEQFTNDLESVPHNVMHVYMGTDPTNQNPDKFGGGFSLDTIFTDSTKTKIVSVDTTQWGYMYQMYSPMDPIFWVHHANIDRLYEKWMIEKIDDDIHNGGRPKKGDFEKYRWDYTFFNAGSDKLTYYDNMSEVFDMSYGIQTYAYDMFIEQDLYNAKYEKKVNKAIMDETWKGDDYETLIVSSTKHTPNLSVGAAADPQFNLFFNPVDPPLKKAKRESWILKVDVKFAEVPRGFFSIFVKDKNKKQSKGDLAGVLTFFGAGHDHSGGRAHNHDGTNMNEKHFRFDVTDEIGLNTFSGDIDFEIIPSVVTDKIVIDDIHLVKEVVVKKKKK